MKEMLLSSAESAAYGARLAGAESSPHYPQPLSTEIAKKLEALDNVDVFDVSSQSAALNAAVGSILSGKRTFVASSFMGPLSDTIRIAQMRLPLVTVDVSRQASSSHPERNLSQFIDAGWLVFIPETNQEILDTIIRCYKLCEEKKIMLPAVISVDHVDFYEAVGLPGEQIIKNFIPNRLGKLRKPKSYVATVQDTEAAFDAIPRIHKNINETWKKKFRRVYELAEAYKLDDAEHVIVTVGMHTATARAAVDIARANGEKVGLLRIASLRPFPDISSLEGKNIAVVDSSHVLYNEIVKRMKCSSFILRSPTEQDFANVIKKMKSTGQ